VTREIADCEVEKRREQCMCVWRKKRRATLLWLQKRRAAQREGRDQPEFGAIREGKSTQDKGRSKLRTV
jgi:hypothetical protein